MAVSRVQTDLQRPFLVHPHKRKSQRQSDAIVPVGNKNDSMSRGLPEVGGAVAVVDDSDGDHSF